jgi:hypothetical protein
MQTCPRGARVQKITRGCSATGSAASRTVIAPTMRKVGGSYRANQVRLLGADTPAAV